MSVWFIVKILGVIAETIGPLPGNVAICLDAVATEERKLDERWPNIKDSPEMIFEGRTLSRGDVTFECVESETRPR
jgi:hypothetical protein